MRFAFQLATALILTFSFCASGVEKLSDDCRFLLMNDSELRASISQMVTQVDAGKSKKVLAADLRLAGNTLLARSSINDRDVLRAFVAARTIDERHRQVEELIPLGIVKKPVASVKLKQFEEFAKFFENAEMKTYAIRRSNEGAPVLAYMNWITVRVKSPFDLDFAQNFHRKLFFHFAYLERERAKFRPLVAAIAKTVADKSGLGEFQAAFIVPVKASGLDYEIPHEGLAHAYPEFLSYAHDAQVMPFIFFLPDLLNMAQLSHESW